MRSSGFLFGARNDLYDPLDSCSEPGMTYAFLWIPVQARNDLCNPLDSCSEPGMTYAILWIPVRSQE